MKEIKCPNCGKVFSVDESDYNHIVSQIRNTEFTKELEKRLHELLELEKARRDESYSKKENALNNEISDLKHQLELMESNKKNDIKDALREKEDIISNLKNELERKVNEKEKEIYKLNNQITYNNKEAELKEKNLYSEFQSKLKSKDDEIQYYRDLKAKLSTKMVGETLEQHCAIEFEKIRPMLGKNVYFEKDNDDKLGSKGDFIYREFNESGIEVISIMFEMKNENEETSTKHKNEDFFKKLDKDRTDKKCEYAILVSMLEEESEIYNSGIVDVSYRYDKMYVVRPQCFIPIITILRNAAYNAVEYKNELSVIKNQNIDVSNFEASLLDFQEKFGKNYLTAQKYFDQAIEEIDKTISHLTKVKESLTTSGNQLRLANDKAQDLSIKKLTRNNPTMKEKFDELKK